MKQKIFNLIILDESGSMGCLHRQTVSGVNESLQTIKNAQNQYEEQEHLVTLISFNGEAIKYHYKCTMAEVTKDLTDNDYHPRSMTPLYDAMGMALTELRTFVNDEDNVLVTIITDGYENASKKYSGKRIYKLVGELREKGWVFTYIGANQDVDKVANEMNIKHRMEFETTDEGMHKMYECERKCRTKFYSRLSSKCFTDEDDFFVNNETDDKHSVNEKQSNLLKRLFKSK